LLQQPAASVSTPILIDRSVDPFKDLDLFAAQSAAMDMVMPSTIPRRIWLVLSAFRLAFCCPSPPIGAGFWRATIAPGIPLCDSSGNRSAATGNR